MKEYLDLTKPVSLYIHVPFCTTKCGYCAFYSLPEAKCGKDDISSYMSVLTCQLEALTDELDFPFHTVYIGGGNPGLLGAENLSGILNLACRRGKSREVSMEINPETLDESFSLLLDRLTRISIGIQSFDPDCLKILGRNATVSQCERALRLLQDFRSDSGLVFNADLMMNIPGQTRSSLFSGIERLASYSPEHISLYSLTFEEGTQLVKTQCPLGEDEEADNLLRAWEKLESLGYEQYEVSAFARNGHYCMHNLVYWNLGQYIGLGPSAESSTGWTSVISSRENEELESYLRNPSFNSIRLSLDETIEEYLMTRLRTKWGIDKAEFSSRFAKDFDQLFSSSVRRLDESWCRNSAERFVLTREGVLVLNKVLLTLFMSL